MSMDSIYMIRIFLYNDTFVFVAVIFAEDRLKFMYN